MDNFTRGLIMLFEARLMWESLPVEYVHTQDGWAGYRGGQRITKYRWTEEAAREDVIEQDARGIIVE